MNRPMLHVTRYANATAFCLVLAVFCVVQVATCPTRDSYLHNFDHGYQLGVGVQVLHGKIPGVDILTHYGPMVFYSSALWHWLSESLLGETFACAVGYALCLAVIYTLVSRHVSAVAGLLAASAGFLLEARFYKWYIWLFPVGTIWLLDRVSGSDRQQRNRWVAATGLWVGLGWLFRWDVGTTGAMACLMFLLLTGARTDSGLAIPWRSSVVFLANFVIPPVAWFGFLLFERGWTGLSFFVWASIKGAVELSRAMAVSLPQFNRADLLSPASTVVLSYWLFPVVYLICAVLWLTAEWRGNSTPRTRLLLAVALVGGSTFHQALHRKGATHLLQVIPPAILGVCVITSVLWDYISEATARGVRTRAARFLGAAFFLFFMIAGLGLSPSGRADLTPLQLLPRQKLRELAHPLDAAGGGSLGSALRLVREVTGRDDPILVFPVDSQFFAFLDRPVSGRLTVFVPGFFDSGDEAVGNLQAIRQEMPRLVLLSPAIAGVDPARPSGFLQDSAKSHAYLARFIEQHYTRKIHESDHCVVLAPRE